MKNWTNYRLGEIGIFKNGINYTADKAGKGIAVINVKDITDHHYINPKCLDLVDYKFKGDDLRAKKGDVFFVRSSVKREGAGEVAILETETDKDITHCGFVIRFRPTINISTKFLFYLLRAEHNREQLRNISSGATIYNISQEGLKKFKLSLPPFSHQHNMASILSAYDNLIEVNNQRIKLLEDTTRELYKEWFVRMRFPNYKKVKKTKGLPDGWNIKKIGEVIDIRNGKKVELSDSGSYRVFGSNGEIGLSNNYNYENVLIIGRVGAYCGSINIGNGKVWATDNTLIAIPNPKLMGFYFSFYFLTLFDLGNYAGGSAQPLVTQSLINNFKIKVPPIELSNKFELIAKPIFEQIKILENKNIQLRQIRDRLLPRLISGKMQVKENSKTKKAVLS